MILRLVVIVLLSAAALGCAGRSSAPVASPSESQETVAGPDDASDSLAGPVDTTALVDRAWEALIDGEAARAVALFARVLAGQPSDADAAFAHLGLARAHEQLRDCAAAIRSYDSYLAMRPDAEDAAEIYARRGACNAELEQWENSAASYRRARELAGDESLPSVRVELAAREGFARFQLAEFTEAEEILREADAIYLAAEEAGSERFTTYYFVGMARFYLGAIHHRRFREVPIRLPERTMAADLAHKFELLTAAQEAYNHTIKAKHMFWVSAAGFQLGSLFEEFYDALMYAPVPDWLDDKQRQVYYEELKDQLRPVVNKAIWVFEKNLETARRLGYESDFIEATEAKLSELQGILLAGDSGWGQPHPRLAPEVRGEIAAAISEEVREGLAAADRKLFVPEPTHL